MMLPHESEYEKPLIHRNQMLAVTGLSGRRFQIWCERGFVPNVTRGAGWQREFSLADALYLTYLRALVDTGVPIPKGVQCASHLFPPIAGLLWSEIDDLLRTSVNPETSRQVLAVIANGRQRLVTKRDLDAAREGRKDDDYWFAMPIPADADAAIVVDLKMIVNRTVTRMREVIARPARRLSQKDNRIRKTEKETK